MSRPGCPGPGAGTAGAALPPYDAVVLAGGSARRLAGVDKPGLRVGQRSLIERVVAAVAGAARVVLVGPAYDGVTVDTLTREEPAGAGPVAAVAAGLAHVGGEHVALLAGDLPFVDAAAVDALRAALQREPTAAVAVAVDRAARDQYLLAVWRTAALRDRLAARADLAGLPLREVYAGAPVARVPLPGRPGGPGPGFDVDTPAQLAEARAWARAGTAEEPSPGPHR